MPTETCKDDGWERRYGNDSRPWLLSSQGAVGNLTTTMKDSFPPIQEKIKTPVGPRKELLEKFLFQEISEEMKEEMLKNPDDDERNSEYKSQFVREGFELPSSDEPVSRSAEEIENNMKHPLYLDIPRTIWVEKIDTLGGKTEPPSSNPMVVFHKNGSFTRHVSQVLDPPKPGTIGYI